MIPNATSPHMVSVGTVGVAGGSNDPGSGVAPRMFTNKEVDSGSGQYPPKSGQAPVPAVGVEVRTGDVRGIGQANGGFQTLVDGPHRVGVSEETIPGGVCSLVPVRVQESDPVLLGGVDVVAHVLHGYLPTTGIRVCWANTAPRIRFVTYSAEIRSGSRPLDITEPGWQVALDDRGCRGAQTFVIAD